MQVGYPACASTTANGVAHVADNTTRFDIDGRSCKCEKGTLFCEKVCRAKGLVTGGEGWQGVVMGGNGVAPGAVFCGTLSAATTLYCPHSHTLCIAPTLPRRQRLAIVRYPSLQAGPGNYFLMNEGESVGFGLSLNS